VHESGCSNRDSCIDDFKDLVMAVFDDAWQLYDTRIQKAVLDRIVSIFGQERTINRVMGETDARQRERILVRLRRVVEDYLNVQCELNTLTHDVDRQNALDISEAQRLRPVYSAQGGYDILHRILMQT
jgi:hypothetical protein